MALYLVLLSTILAFSLGSAEPPGSSISSMKNWITKVDTQPLSVNVQQGTSNKTEQLARPSLHDTSMSAAAASTSTSTATATAPSSTTTTTTTTTSTSTTITTTTTTTTPTRTNVSSPTTTTTATTSTNASSTTTTSITTTSTPSMTITTTTIITTITTTPMSCPHSGYQLYAEFNCYKAYPGERKSWTEAREQCRRDGGDLMVTETERERREVLIPLYKNMTFYLNPWVGVYIPEGGKDWISVRGQPALSTWWLPGEPDGNALRACAFADATGPMWNEYCTVARPFICEISL